MAYYAIFDTDVFDAEAYKEYQAKVGAGITAHGGKYLSAGGELQVMEGDWPLHRIVMLEFPDKGAFERWYFGADYQALKLIRDRTVRSKAFGVGGFEPEFSARHSGQT
jgi:uncharacterized protein (DUF1330 family)